jgi:glycosyltransferase involved in cell wall biosynthesis
VIIIDDNSPDGTLEVAQELQKLYGEDRIVRFPTSYFRSQSRIYRITLSSESVFMTLILLPSILVVKPASYLLYFHFSQVLRPRPGKLGLGTHIETLFIFQFGILRCCIRDFGSHHCHFHCRNCLHSWN